MIWECDYNQKRTKIVATFGPALTGKLFTWQQFKANKKQKDQAYKRVEQAFLSGLDVARLNFSHGNYEEQSIRIKIIRDVAKKLNKNIAIILDTKGPEIRVGKVVDKRGNDRKIEIAKGSILTIKTKDFKPCTKDNEIYVYDSTKTYNMAKDLKVGKYILIDDGKLQLKVVSIDVVKGIIKAQALNTHTIYEKKRINLPNTKYTLPFLSQKDKEDIKFAIDNDLDSIALSFVNNKENINEVKKYIAKYKPNKHIQLIAKIETNEAINNINDIIKNTDGIMIARGDLALEVPFYNIPYFEKYILDLCNKHKKYSIVATQMLDSLERNIQPTRAEVSDVFFAVENGSDATMLSGESANGLFPLEAIKTMAAIDIAAEQTFDYQKYFNKYFMPKKFPPKYKNLAKFLFTKALPKKTKDHFPSFPISNIVMFSNDPKEIEAIWKARVASKIYVATSNKTILKYFAVSYGLNLLYCPNKITKTNIKQIVLKLKKDLKLKGKSYYLNDNNLYNI